MRSFTCRTPRNITGPFPWANGHFIYHADNLDRLNVPTFSHAPRPSRAEQERKKNIEIISLCRKPDVMIKVDVV